jgi:acetyl esterase/lipase
MNPLRKMIVTTVTLSLMILLTAAKRDRDASNEPAGETTVLLWPKDSKLNSPKGMGTEKKGKAGDPSVSDITTPHLKVYPGPESSKPTPAIILVPGGGYKMLVHSKHWETQKWLKEKGIRAFILMYRCPTETDSKGALDDIQEAIRMVRSKAKEWNIDPKRIGILGSSAGGHLSVRASLAEGDGSARPDFAILLYPAYVADTKSNQLSAGLNVSKTAPPTLIFAAKDDKAFFSNSPIYEAALKKAGVPVRSQYFETGGHGFTLRAPQSVSTWPETCEAWLKERSILP